MSNARIVKVRSDYYEVYVDGKLHICGGPNAEFFARLIAGQIKKGGSDGNNQRAD